MLSEGRAGHGGAGQGRAGRRGGGDQDHREAGQDGADDPVAAARQICLRLLAAAPRTRAELANALGRRGVPGEAAGAVLGRFADVGLIDDAAFARAWVESRHHGRGLARQALAAELRRRGVDAEDVRTAIEALSPGDELATARRLVAQRAASSRGRPLPARVRQLMGILARKGYPAGLAYRVVREVLEQERPADGLAEIDEMADAAVEE
ncbi:MAG: regulatory protein RecX [Actinobacteria bacterium]|nr:regulatory protein RecX [Actinomycetota bacterium]